MSCDPALLGLDQAKQDARKAGFARSVRADQRHDFAAGYRNVAGVFGVHRYHHVREDDARCVSPDAVAETSFAFQRLLQEALR